MILLDIKYQICNFFSTWGNLGLALLIAYQVIIENGRFSVNDKRKKIITNSIVSLILTIIIAYSSFHISKIKDQIIEDTKINTDSTVVALRITKDSINKILFRLENVNVTVNKTLDRFEYQNRQFNKLLLDSKVQININKKMLDAKILAEKPNLSLFFENIKNEDHSFNIILKTINTGNRPALNFNGEIILACHDSTKKLLDIEYIKVNNFNVLHSASLYTNAIKFHNFNLNNNLYFDCIFIYNYKDEYLKPVTDTIYSFCKPFINNNLVTSYTSEILNKVPLLNSYKNRELIAKKDTISLK